MNAPAPSPSQECHHCGTEIDDSNSLGVEIAGQLEDVCSSCHDELTHTCQICGRSDVMESELSGYILCKKELAHVPGIYRILHRPFLLQSIIGSTTLFEDDVLFIDRLPQRDEHYEISGHLCKKCAKPYHQTYLAAYRPVPWMLKRYGKELHGVSGRTARQTRRAKWECLLAKSYGRVGGVLRRRHLRRVILQNPDMLRDLECDPTTQDAAGHSLSGADDSPWEDLQEWLKSGAGFQPALPELPTYHEWVFIEHRGVKVYYAGYKSADSWMTWHPEPRFRRHGHGPDCFSIGSLPNAEKHRAALDYWRERISHYDTEPAIARAVAREAIELGYIRQDGTYDSHGRPARYE